MSIFGTARPGFYYPRLTYSAGPAVNLDFDDPVTPQVIPLAIRGDRTATDGTRESLYERTEYQVRLIAGLIDKAMFDAVWAWWRDWASQGEPSVLTLDRLSGCAGQWEYDQFNTYFSLAELVDTGLQWQRMRSARGPAYSVSLLLRQGVAA